MRLPVGQTEASPNPNAGSFGMSIRLISIFGGFGEAQDRTVLPGCGGACVAHPLTHQNLLTYERSPHKGIGRETRHRNLGAKNYKFASSQSAAKSMPIWRLSTWACSAPPSAVVKILMVLFVEPTAS
jgi:hypothetical protein